jgi:signal transduction histidine kinase
MTLSATGDSGAEVRVTAIFRDQTEARRKAARQRLLGELGHELAKAQEYEAVFRLIANLMVPALADWAVVDLCGPDGALSRLVAAHGDPRKQRIADRYLERSTRLKADREELQRVIRTGQSLLWADGALEALRAAGRDPETLALVEQLGIRALLRVPLKARGRTLGVLTLAASERAFTGEDLHFAEEVAQRGSLVADNKRLLEQATREATLRKDVVAIVSHDLRNPMHAIRLNARLLEQLLAHHPGGPLPVERLQPIAGAIERAVDRGTRLITDLLDTAQMEAGSFSVQRRPTSLAGVFQAVLELLVPIAREKGVTLQASAPARVVPCDPDRISQALANLVGNAIKFTPPGGRIELFAEEGRGEVRIAVRDSGRGLSAEVLPHVFERFWQAERGRRTGAGLGLSIVKGIVEAHGGRVWAQSRPGEGSTFWISLPAELPGEVGLRAVGPA